MSLLLAATVSTTTPVSVENCKITGIVEEVASSSVKLKIGESEAECENRFPKNSSLTFFISGSKLVRGTTIEGVFTKEEKPLLKSYRILSVADEKTNLQPEQKTSPTTTPISQTLQVKESFFTRLINAIKGLFGRGK